MGKGESLRKREDYLEENKEIMQKNRGRKRATGLKNAASRR